MRPSDKNVQVVSDLCDLLRNPRAQTLHMSPDAHPLTSVVTQAELPRGDRQPGGDPEVRGDLRRGDQDARPRLQVLPGPGKGAIRTLLPSHETSSLSRRCFNKMFHLQLSFLLKSLSSKLRLVRRAPRGARRREQGGRREARRGQHAHQHLLRSQGQGQSSRGLHNSHIFN